MASIIKKIKNEKKNKGSSNSNLNQQQANQQNNTQQTQNNRENVNQVQVINHLSASQPIIRKSSNNVISSPVICSTSYSYSQSPITNTTNLKKSASYSPNSNNPQNSENVLNPKVKNRANANNTISSSSSGYYNNVISGTSNISTNNSNKFLSPSSRLPSSASMYFSPKLQVSPPPSPPLSPTSAKENSNNNNNSSSPTPTLSTKKSLLFLDFTGSKRKKQQIDQQSQQIRENTEELERLRHEVSALNVAANNYIKDKFKSEEEIQNLQIKNRELTQTNNYLLKVLSDYKNDINTLRRLVEQSSAPALSDSTISIPSPHTLTPPASPEDPASQQAMVEDAIASIEDAMTFIFSKPPPTSATNPNSPYRRYLRSKKSFVFEQQQILQQQQQKEQILLHLQQQYDTTINEKETTTTTTTTTNNSTNNLNHCFNNSCLNTSSIEQLNSLLSCDSNSRLIPTPSDLSSSQDISSSTTPTSTTSTSSSPIEASPELKSQEAPCTFLQRSISQPSSTITSPQTLSISITSVSSVSDGVNSIDITPPSTASNTATANTPTTQSQQQLPQQLQTITISSPSPSSQSQSPNSSTPPINGNNLNNSSSGGNILSVSTSKVAQTLKRFNEERPHSPLNRTKSLMNNINGATSPQNNSSGTFTFNKLRINDIPIGSSTSTCETIITSQSNSSPSSPMDGSPRPQRNHNNSKYNTLSNNSKQTVNSNKPRISLSKSTITPAQPLISTSARPILKSPSIPGSPQFDSANNPNNSNMKMKKLIDFFDQPKPNFKL